MDLATLGQIAGLAGLAVGAVVLVFRSLVEKGLGGMPAKDRARVVTTIALCAFGIGVAGIAAWTFAGTQGGTSVVTHGAQSPGVVGGRDVSIGIGGSAPTGAPAPGPPGAPPPAVAPAPTAPPSDTRIETRGVQSPGVAAGGDVRIQMDGAGSPPGAPPRP
jgi:hypothetical protein